VPWGTPSEKALPARLARRIGSRNGFARGAVVWLTVGFLRCRYGYKDLASKGLKSGKPTGLT
jgi:hypothetical protein